MSVLLCDSHRRGISGCAPLQMCRSLERNSRGEPHLEERQKVSSVSTASSFVEICGRLHRPSPTKQNQHRENSVSSRFTHIGIDDLRVVHANLTGEKRVTTGRKFPYCLYTDRELCSYQSPRNESASASARNPISAIQSADGNNLRAPTLSETRGFPKALVETDGDHVLGFTVSE